MEAVRSKQPLQAKVTDTSLGLDGYDQRAVTGDPDDPDVPD